MIGQVEPLQVGTHIKAKISEEKNDYIDYKIISYMAHGGSAIVYKALRYDVYRNRNVILKEYCYLNNHSSDSYTRRGGVIVKKENDNIPVSVSFRDLAKKEMENNQDCSGGKCSKICSIDKVLLAYEIDEPDNEESASWDGKIIGIFAEMDSYNHVYSYQEIIKAIQNELYDLDENTKKHKELKNLLSTDTSSLSAYGIMTLMDSILKSVQTIHDNSWVHKDLKLSNMLFEKEAGDDYLQGTTVLIDFGSAQKLIDGTNPLHAPKGTPPYTEGTTKGYQPPEILEENLNKYHFEGWTKASDIYQLGCIMYYMLCGKFPPKYFITDTELNKIDEILANYHLSELVYSLVKNMMLKSISSNPSQRYADISAYKEDLDEVNTQLSNSADAVNGNREIIKKADLNKIDNEDYAILFELFDEIKDKLIEAGYYDNNYTLVKNEEELNKLGLLCIEYYARHANKGCVKSGLTYLASFHALYSQGYEVNISSVVISSVGSAVEELLVDGSGLQLVRESFRFYQLEIKDPNLSKLYKCPIEVKSWLYTCLYDTLALNEINLNNYYELKYIIDEWKKVLEDPFFDSEYSDKFFFNICCIRLCIYDRYYSKAFEYLEQCKKYCENEVTEYSKLRGNFLIKWYATQIHFQMHEYNTAREYALKCIEISNNELLKADGSTLFGVYEHLRYIYFYMDDPDQAAYYTIQSILQAKIGMSRSPILAEIAYKRSICFAEKIYNSNINTYNMVQLGLLLDEEHSNQIPQQPQKIIPQAPISFDKISSSLNLCIGSAFIPTKMQPIAKKNLKDKQITNILNGYGAGLTKDDIIAIIDSSLLRKGNTGTVFTKDGICSSYFQTKRLIKYEELKDVALTKDGNIALTFNNGQYEENAVPEAKLLVAILKGETKIRL